MQRMWKEMPVTKRDSPSQHLRVKTEETREKHVQIVLSSKFQAGLLTIYPIQ